MSKKDEALKLAREALEASKRTHHYCEDIWYSCPKHEDGCANESEGDECNCGADEANAQLDKAITAIDEALAEQPAPPPPPECQTEAEKTAFAFGWWKALEQKRKADSALDRMADNARELGLDYEPAQQQEPVAWVCYGATVNHHDIDFDQNEIDAIPLGTMLYTSPQPSKPWVGLEEQDMPDGENPMYDDPRFIAGMVWANNKLREKNT